MKTILSFTIILFALNLSAQFPDWGDFDDCNNPWVLCNTETQTEEDPDPKDKGEKEDEDDDWPEIISPRDPWADDPPPKDPPEGEEPETPLPPTGEIRDPWAECDSKEKSYSIAGKNMRAVASFESRMDKVKLKKELSRKRIGSIQYATYNGIKYTYILKSKTDFNPNTHDKYDVVYKVTWKNSKGRTIWRPLLIRVFPKKLVFYTS